MPGTGPSPAGIVSVPGSVHESVADRLWSVSANASRSAYAGGDHDSPESGDPAERPPAERGPGTQSAGA
jgi:hypothetical protein